MKPKVSILWINYNSSSFINLALESLQAIKNLDYPNYELIIVDNNSTDGSFEQIQKFVKENNIKSKIIRLKKNLGFTGGNNAAYAVRDPNSKYVVLLNNDAVPRKNSLSQLVQIMENDKQLGAAQGIILNYNEKTVDTAGDFISELLETHTFLQGKTPKNLQKPILVTFANAVYSIFRVETIQKMNNAKNRIFDNLFACFDDQLLGLRIWNAGYKIKSFPIITAKHNRGSSFKKVKLLQLYLISKNVLMVNEASNSRYKNLIKLLFLRQLFGWFVTKILGLINDPEYKKLPAVLLKGFIDGIKMGIIKKKIEGRLDIYKAPILKIDVHEAFLRAISQQLFEQRIKTKLDSFLTK